MNKTVRGLKDGMILHGAVVGTVVSILISLAGVAVLSGLLLNETLVWTSVHVYTWVLLILASLLGAVVAERIAGSKYAIVAGVVSGLYVLILVTTTILFFDGMFDHMIGNGIAVLIGAAGACAICIRSGGRAKGKKRHFR